MRRKHAYLIMAHSDFDLLKILIRMLDFEYNDIYIHIDKKSNYSNFEELYNCVKLSKIYIYKEIKIYWGDFSQTQCELFLMEKASKGEYRYFHLLSGFDLPIKSQAFIHDFFEKNDGKEFVSFWGPKMQEKCYEWIKYYHFMQQFLRISRNNLINRLFYAVETFSIWLQSIIGIDRIKNSNMIFQKGTNWFSITNDLVEFVLSHKKWVNQTFKYTRSSDEVFLQTIITNSIYKSRLPDNIYEIHGGFGLRYVDWVRGKPYVFRMEDYEELKSSEYLFARKFSLNVDRDIVNKLSSEIK